jgi:hypothetical protein
MSARFIAPQRPRHSRAAVATFVTIAAASTAWLLAAVVQLPEQAVVLTVMVLAFTSSWFVSNVATTSSHRRVTLARARAHSR